MINIRPDEITNIIRQQIESYDQEVQVDNVGTVLQIGDGIARVYGLEQVMAGELLEFADKTIGIALNLENDNVGAVLMGTGIDILEGSSVRSTGKIAQVPVGDAFRGRVVDALARPIDGKGDIPSTESRQRELIIGDRQTGKTSVAIDTILNQKGEECVCVYVAVGQKASSVAAVVNVLEERGASEYTIVVTANADDPATLQYIAPYTGAALAEYFMYNGQATLTIYDDLTKQASAYRQMSLLLRRPPGREA